jgi:hypothetical protein
MAKSENEKARFGGGLKKLKLFYKLQITNQ